MRLTLHPVLYSRSEAIVHWNRGSLGLKRPQEVVTQAIALYPALPLSSAVEAVLLDLIAENASKPIGLSEEENRQLNRFADLPVLEKIRIMRNRIRTYRYLRNLTV